MEEGTTPETFGAVIKERRIELGLTQVKVAESVGRSPSTIRSWERDRTVPNEPGVLAALAASLDLADSAVFDLAGVPRAEQDDSSAGNLFDPPAKSDGDAADGTLDPAPEPEIAAPIIDVDELADLDPQPEPEAPPAVEAVDVEDPDEPSVEEQVDEMPTVIEFHEGDESDRDVVDGPADDDFSASIDEPTAVLVRTRSERILGVATAAAIEFVAEPKFPVPAPEPEPEIDVSLQPTAVSSVATATRPVQQPARSGPQVPTQTLTQSRPVGPNSYLDDPVEVRGYRIRAGLTVAGCLILLYAGVWAWRGFRESLSAILDGLITGF